MSGWEKENRSQLFYVTAKTNLARHYIVSFTHPLVTPVMWSSTNISYFFLILQITVYNFQIIHPSLASELYDQSYKTPPCIHVYNLYKDISLLLNKKGPNTEPWQLLTLPLTIYASCTPGKKLGHAEEIILQVTITRECDRTNNSELGLNTWIWIC